MPIYTPTMVAEVQGYLDRVRPGERTLLLRFAKASGGPVLELASGAGRVMREIASAGIETWGIEASAAMLELAAQTAAGLPAEVRSHMHFIKGDMCNFALARKFPFIMIPFNSLWSNLDENGAERCVELIISHLATPGRFAIDMPISRDGDDSQQRSWWAQMARKYNFLYRIYLYNSYRTGGGGMERPILIGRHKIVNHY